MAPYSVEDAYVPREIVFFDLEGLDLDLCSPSAASVDLCTEWPYWDRAVYRLGLAGERPVVVQPEDRRELWVRHVEGPWDALDGIDHLADPYLTLHRVIEVDYDCTLVGADERG